MGFIREASEAVHHYLAPKTKEIMDSDGNQYMLDGSTDVQIIELTDSELGSMPTVDNHAVP